LEEGEQPVVPFMIGSNADENELFLPDVIHSCADYESELESVFGASKASILELYPCADFENARHALVDVFTDATFTCPARRVAQAGAAGGHTQIHRYYYTYTRADPYLRALRAFHGAELSLIFGTHAYLGYTPPAVEDQLAERMQRAWASFARDLEPGRVGGEVWTSYDAQLDNALVFDAQVTVMNGVDSTKCDFWDSFSP
jgi:para-nitrobenzyl esterase